MIKCLWLLNILEHLSSPIIRHNKNIFRTFKYIGWHPKIYRLPWISPLTHSKSSSSWTSKLSQMNGSSSVGFATDGRSLITKGRCDSWVLTTWKVPKVPLVSYPSYLILKSYQFGKIFSLGSSFTSSSHILMKLDEGPDEAKSDS